jgi:hypothetical protein
MLTQRPCALRGHPGDTPVVCTDTALAGAESKWATAGKPVVAFYFVSFRLRFRYVSFNFRNYEKHDKHRQYNQLVTQIRYFQYIKDSKEY